MDDFSSVNVGDRLWLIDSRYIGWIRVERITTGEYPISVEKYGTFTVLGQYMKDGPQCLFWDEVIIIPPPKPKRLVTKMLEGLVNVYPNHIGCYFYPTRKSAKDAATGDVIATVKVTGTYEVEE